MICFDVANGAIATCSIAYIATSVIIDIIEQVVNYLSWLILLIGDPGFLLEEDDQISRRTLPGRPLSVATLVGTWLI